MGMEDIASLIDKNCNTKMMLEMNNSHLHLIL